MSNYVPNNSIVFAAALTGALSGMMSTGQCTDTTAADINPVAAAALAYAQEFDTIWGTASVNTFQEHSIRTISGQVWQNRLANSSGVFATPSTYSGVVNGIIAVITAGSTAISGQSITPPNQPGLGLFGDGSDASPTFDGTTTHNAYSSLAGGNYTLTRDVFLANGTINSGVTIFTAGFRILCTGQLNNLGTISNNGNAGQAGSGGGAGGTATASGSLGGGTAGGAGGAGAGGTNGSNGSHNVTGQQAGGAGGAATNAGGSGGSANTDAVPINPRCLQTLALINNNILPSGGIGGGGGGSDNAAATGGGGGAGGGVMEIAALSLFNSGTISSNGGIGGAGNAGGHNAGGGGGGSGGLVFIVSRVNTGAGTITASGGAGGAGAGTGAAGSAGSAGLVIQLGA